jgi:type VI secretion system secreted protein VgrG
MTLSHPDYPKTIFKPPMKISLLQSPLAKGHGLAGMPYTLKADGAEIQKGVLDENDFLRVEHDINTKAYELELGNGRVIKIPVVNEYSNPKKGKLANLGFNKVLDGDSPAKGDAREIYQLSLMKNKKTNQNKEES